MLKSRPSSKRPSLHVTPDNEKVAQMKKERICIQTEREKIREERKKERDSKQEGERYKNKVVPRKRE